MYPKYRAADVNVKPRARVPAGSAAPRVPWRWRERATASSPRLCRDPAQGALRSDRRVPLRWFLPRHDGWRFRRRSQGSTAARKRSVSVASRPDPPPTVPTPQMKACSALCCSMNRSTDPATRFSRRSAKNNWSSASSSSRCTARRAASPSRTARISNSSTSSSPFSSTTTAPRFGADRHQPFEIKLPDRLSHRHAAESEFHRDLLGDNPRPTRPTDPSECGPGSGYKRGSGPTLRRS